MQGLVTEQGSGRRASRVQVYGVDDRFWQFHGVAGPIGTGRTATPFVSRALAADIGAADGGTILVRVERPSAIPIESLHGRKEDPGRTLRLTVRAILDRSAARRVLAPAAAGRRARRVRAARAGCSRTSIAGARQRAARRRTAPRTTERSAASALGCS